MQGLKLGPYEFWHSPFPNPIPQSICSTYFNLNCARCNSSIVKAVAATVPKNDFVFNELNSRYF